MRLIAVFLAAALPAALSAADTPGLGEDLFPLAVGNTWTYKVDRQEERFVIRVARQQMVGEQTCFILEGKLKDRVVATEHVAFTTKGLTRFRADTQDIEPPVTVLQIPLARKSSWSMPEFQVGGRKAAATFTQDPAGAAAFVTVPAGRFRATVIQGDMTGDSGSRTTTVWYAAGVGIVKQTIGDPKRAPYFGMDLEEYQKGE